MGVRTYTQSELLSYESEDFDAKMFMKGNPMVAVECCDGIKHTRNRILMASWPYLIMNKMHNVPICMGQIPNEDDIPTGDFHFNYMDFALKYAYEYFNGEVPLPELAKAGSYSLDAAINFTIRSLEGYGLTIDAEDVLELYFHPYVLKLRDDTIVILQSDATDEAKSTAINTAYEELYRWVKNEAIRELPHNGIIQHIKADAAKKDQFLLLIMMVGYTSEINSALYNVPVVEGMAVGMNYDYSFVTNIVKSSRAMMYSKNPIEDTETLNRVLQMQAAEVKNVHVGDCGSKVTFAAQVTKHNHRSMVGMFYLEDGKVREITKANCREHIGKVRHMRFNAGCAIEDPNGCCTVCGGASTLSVVEHANVGHLKQVTIIGGVSQHVLKAKHAELMAVGMRPFVEPALLEFFDISDDNRCLNYGVNAPDITITFSAQATREKLREKDRHGSLLHTVRNVKDVRATNASNYTEIDTVSIRPNDTTTGASIVDRVKLNRESSLPLSYDALEYVRDHPEKLELQLGKGAVYFYHLNLDEFKRGAPLFQLPFQNFDIFMQYKIVKRFMTSPMKHSYGECLSDYTNMGEAAMALLEMTIDKLGVDLSTILMAIWPFSVQSVRERNFNIVKHSNECQFLPVDRLYNERSMAPKLLYRDQKDVLGKLRSVTHTNRNPHPYDPLYTQTPV